MPNFSNAPTRRSVLSISAAAALSSTAAVQAQVPQITDVRAHLRIEMARSKPDYVCYMPGHWDGSTHDGLNEHFLVFDGPDRSFMAVWTQSDIGSGLPTTGQKNRIMFSRSDDDGVTWAPPMHIAGPKTHTDPEFMSSWAFPMVSKRGRIYVVYNQNIGNRGWVEMHTGKMAGICSDDNGRTWSKPQFIPMPESQYDDPEGKIPAEWIVWQTPMRDRSGGFLVGYTHWLNPARCRMKKVEAWTQHESVVEFMRFTNVDAHPETAALKVRYSGWGEKALRAPYYRDPLMTVAQEPSIVRLPDQRLFCVMRSNSGYIWYSVSGDDGENWCSPRPLLRKDFGTPILQPVSCSPLYQLSDGRYVLLHHENRGGYTEKPEGTWGPRRPAFIALAEFRPKADQPLWFSASKQLMDNGDAGVDGNPASKQKNIGVYTSFSTRKGNNVLWHPERKFFLLGKKITPEFLSDLKVPR
ncbi:MAG: exo-alpha-sialidase [Bryobacteraceae bacterium]|nr:exo-alpha-sialidase [Bryobacteraceae bacterium]